MDLHTCLICEKTGENLICVVRGKNSLIEASEQRKDGKKEAYENAVQIYVHKYCRKDYIKPQSIEAYKRKQGNCNPDSSDGSARSILLGFNIKDNCFICGELIGECSRSKKQNHVQWCKVKNSKRVLRKYVNHEMTSTALIFKCVFVHMT